MIQTIIPQIAEKKQKGAASNLKIEQNISLLDARIDQISSYQELTVVLTTGTAACNAYVIQ